MDSSRPICFNSRIHLLLPFQEEVMLLLFCYEQQVYVHVFLKYRCTWMCSCIDLVDRISHIKSEPLVSLERIRRSNRTWSRLDNASVSFIFRLITFSIIYYWCDVNSFISYRRCLGRALAHFGSLFNMWCQMKTLIVLYFYFIWV